MGLHIWQGIWLSPLIADSFLPIIHLKRIKNQNTPCHLWNGPLRPGLLERIRSIPAIQWQEKEIPDLPVVCPTKIRAGVEQGRRAKPGGQGDVGLLTLSPLFPFGHRCFGSPSAAAASKTSRAVWIPPRLCLGNYQGWSTGRCLNSRGFRRKSMRAVFSFFMICPNEDFLLKTVCFTLLQGRGPTSAGHNHRAVL